MTNLPPKSRDGATGGGGACRPRILRLRHQRNKRPREPRSSFASQEITTLVYLVDYSKLHSLGEIEISENDGRNDSGSQKHQAVLLSHAELSANISGFRHGLEFETGLVYRDSLLGRSGAWKGNSSSPSAFRAASIPFSSCGFRLPKYKLINSLSRRISVRLRCVSIPLSISRCASSICSYRSLIRSINTAF